MARTGWIGKLSAIVRFYGRCHQPICLADAALSLWSDAELFAQKFGTSSGFTPPIKTHFPPALLPARQNHGGKISSRDRDNDGSRNQNCTGGNRANGESERWRQKNRRRSIEERRNRRGGKLTNLAQQSRGRESVPVAGPFKAGDAGEVLIGGHQPQFLAQGRCGYESIGSRESFPLLGALKTQF